MKRYETARPSSTKRVRISRWTEPLRLLLPPHGDEFLPALEAWIVTNPLIDPDSPESPFAMEEYRLAEAETVGILRDQAEEHTAAAMSAARNSDDHVLRAVVLALAIFFAGIATKLESDRNRLSLVVLSDAVFIGALIFLVLLPKVPIW